MSTPVLAQIDRKSNVLALQQFYGTNVYKNIFHSNTTSYEVDPYVEPQMGWKTNKSKVENPTKVAADGLYLILNGNVAVAEKHAQWLMANSKQVGDSIFFPFQFDFAPYWPYHLEAPWNSGLTQGLSLGLFSYLYKATSNDAYKSIAEQIYKSYSLSIEKGGFMRFEEEGPFIEEYPTSIPTRVFNGSIVSMMALYDYSVITGNHDARELFDKCVKRLELLLPEYEVNLPNVDFPVSAYSLAPKRFEVLGRFVGEGKAFVDRIKVIEKNSSEEVIIGNVDVGTDEDSDVMNAAYIWSDPKAMNWGESVTLGNNHGRIVNEIKGSMNHSPFKFIIPNSSVNSAYYVEVTYKVMGEKPLSIQLYDGVEYWALGELTNKSNQLITERFKISPNFLESSVKKFDSSPLIDEKYLDDNQILLELLGKISSSKKATEYAQRWSNSHKLTPAQWTNHFPKDILIAQSKPILTVEKRWGESRSISNPSVITINGKQFMFYSGVGDDNRWRIFLSTSDDGSTWERQGQIFNDSSLPFKGDYSFPEIVAQQKNGKISYLMFFTAASGPGEEMNQVFMAKSNDAWTWKLEQLVIKDNAIDPYVIISDSQYELYYINNGTSTSKIMRSISHDGVKWSSPKQMLITNSSWGERYTGINGMDVGGEKFLLIENTSPIKHTQYLYQMSNGQLLSDEMQYPLIIDKDWIDGWDVRKFNYDIVNEEGQYKVYYGGGLATKNNLDIGKATIGHQEIISITNALKKR